MRLSAAPAQPTGRSSAHGTAAVVLVGEFSVVFYTVFVVAEDGVGGAYGDEAVGGMWVITIAVGVMGFAQLKVASGECVRLWGGWRRGTCFLISARVAWRGRPKVS